jgi:hypothetical protein
MSTGQWLGGIGGAVVGGVIGWFMGNWVGLAYGIVYGATIGYSIGSYVDPITPDIDAPAAPTVEQNVMSSTIGVPVPDLMGTAKIKGHLLAFGKERAVPQLVKIDDGGK